jgi:hypothetical protein
VCIVYVCMCVRQVCFLQYVRRVVPGRVALVADLTVSPLQGQSQALLGAEVNMKQSRILTTVDQEGVISSSLECRVSRAEQHVTMSVWCVGRGALLFSGPLIDQRVRVCVVWRQVIPNAINLVLAAKIKQSEEKYEFGYGACQSTLSSPLFRLHHLPSAAHSELLILCVCRVTCPQDSTSPSNRPGGTGLGWVGWGRGGGGDVHACA